MNHILYMQIKTLTRLVRIDCRLNQQETLLFSMLFTWNRHMHQMKRTVPCLWDASMPPEDMASPCDMASSSDGEEMPLETILEGVRHQSNQAGIHPHQPTDAVCLWNDLVELLS